MFCSICKGKAIVPNVRTVLATELIDCHSVLSLKQSTALSLKQYQGRRDFLCSKELCALDDNFTSWEILITSQKGIPTMFSNKRSHMVWEMFDNLLRAGLHHRCRFTWWSKAVPSDPRLSTLSSAVKQFFLLPSGSMRCTGMLREIQFETIWLVFRARCVSSFCYRAIRARLFFIDLWVCYVSLHSSWIVYGEDVSSVRGDNYLTKECWTCDVQKTFPSEFSLR